MFVACPTNISYRSVSNWATTEFVTFYSLIYLWSANISVWTKAPHAHAFTWLPVCRPMDFNIFTTALTSKHSAIQRRCEKKNGEGIKSNKPDSTANVKLPLMNVNKLLFLFVMRKCIRWRSTHWVEFRYVILLSARCIGISNDQILIFR